jgi:membrane fusion protein, multidrug efflux system
MIKRLIIAVVLLTLVGGGLVWFNFFRDRMIADYFANAPVQSLTVSTVEAEPVTWQPAIDAIGTARALQGVDLTVEAAGIVKEIPFKSNEQIEGGQVLLRLDDAVQLADLEAARTQLELDELTLQRTRDLQTRGVATSVSLDSAQAAFQAAQAQMARATALAEQRRMVAPFSGTIGLPRVELGQYVSPGTIVTTLQDLETMRVDFSLPEQQLPHISIGQRLSVRTEGLDQSFDGEVTGIDPRVDPSSRMVAVRGTISNADGQITPGQFVRIRVQLPSEDDIIALPQTAVISSLYGDYVYAVRPRADDTGTLEARQVFVQVGRRSDGLVEIAGGIAPGDIIISAGQNRLSNGTPVVLEKKDGGDERPEDTAAAK